MNIPYFALPSFDFSNLAASIQKIPAGWFAFIIAFLGLGLYFAIKNVIPQLKAIKNIRAINNSKIQFATQGYIKLTGTISPLQQDLRSPLTDTPCCYFSCLVETLTRKHDAVNKNSIGGNRWTTMAYEKSDNYFLLNDGTGECIISPQGADVVTNNKSRWRSKTIPDRFWDYLQKRITGVNVRTMSFANNYRLTDTILKPGDTLTVLGFFKTLPATTENVFTDSDLFLKQKKSVTARIKKINQQWQIEKSSFTGKSNMLNILTMLGDADKPYIFSTLTTQKLLKHYYKQFIGKAIIAAGISLFIIAGIILRFMPIT